MKLYSENKQHILKRLAVAIDANPRVLTSDAEKNPLPADPDPGAKSAERPEVFPAEAPQGAPGVLVGPKIDFSVPRTRKGASPRKAAPSAAAGVREAPETEQPEQKEEFCQISARRDVVRDAVQEEREAILQTARKEGERLVRQARLDAEEILVIAQGQKEAWRREASRNAREEALPAAISEGRELGRQEIRRELEATLGRAAAMVEALERIWHDELAKVDEDLLELTLKISERIVGTVLRYDKDKLLTMIRSLILIPNERRNLKIHVSNADWEWLTNLKERGLPPYPLIRDEMLEQGDVVIESSEGVFDARLETQLDKFREILSEELINGQLESANRESELY